MKPYRRGAAKRLRIEVGAESVLDVKGQLRLIRRYRFGYWLRFINRLNYHFEKLGKNNKITVSFTGRSPISWIAGNTP